MHSAAAEPGSAKAREREPSGRLLAELVNGPSLITRAVWHDRIGSTNAEAGRLAAELVAGEGLLVLADEQTAGRGRRGRSWHAPPGTSLMGSLLLSPGVPPEFLPLLPLLTGLCLVEAAEPLVSGAHLSLKWPNDLLAGPAETGTPECEPRKCAGILVEAPATTTVIVGFGVNTDWRGVQRPAELATATSLSEVGRGGVDRWQLLRAFVERFDRRYRDWRADPPVFLPAYRERCATLGSAVRVEQLDGQAVSGTAARVTGDGALELEVDGSTVVVRAGDVQHLRHA
jgi:BirA family transcriptional regulator, biotin operon repressor / biotin---[acetyl-CoA-carboxylase] ligase